MKINFLGTSAGWPLPRLGCNCEICRSGDPKDRRTRTQILVNDSILLDAGPDTYNHLIKQKFANRLKAILISHPHLDHILGFHDLPHTYNLEAETTLYVTQPVLTGIRKVFSLPLNPIKIKVVKPNEPFMIDHTKIEYFPVVHGKTPTYGIKVKDNKIFVYIPDFKKILPSQQRVIRHCDILVIDGSTLGKLGQGPGHISIQDGITIAKRLKAKSVYFIHIGHKTGKHRFLENHLKEKAGSNFHIAFDSQELLV